MKKYFVRFDYPQWTLNEYILRASSEESAVAEAVAWHMRDREEQGHTVWEEDDSPSNPNLLKLLGVSVSELENE